MSRHRRKRNSLLSTGKRLLKQFVIVKNDVRYSEFLFLCDLEKKTVSFNPNDRTKQDELGLGQTLLIEMVIALVEDLHVRIEDQDLQLLAGRLRREIRSEQPPSRIAQYQWDNPRAALADKFLEGQAYGLRITYRGMRRIEELREILKRDRILEPFGVMLDIRYFPKELEEALQRPANVSVSVLRIDMDNFKGINDNFGHAAGDVVMKAYLEAARNCVQAVGSSFRGRGDEVVAIIVGQDHSRVLGIAEAIRQAVESLQCKFNDIVLPKVTASIGVATTPPDLRAMDLETLADQRQRRAKIEGKNRIVAN